MTVLTVHGLTKRYGRNTILSNVSFSVRNGEILGLIGPNGAGKTTLLECITGLLPFSSGSIGIDSRSLSPAERNRLLWYQPDDSRPFARQKVSITLEFFRKLHARKQAALDRLIDRLQLSSVLSKPLQALSKGYRRRVLLAVALLSRQTLLLLDEPFDGLDLRQSLSVMDLLRDVRKERTLLLSIHQLSEAEKICDRFLLLGAGRVLALGSLDELRGHCALDSTASLEEVFLALT